MNAAREVIDFANQAQRLAEIEALELHRAFGTTKRRASG